MKLGSALLVDQFAAFSITPETKAGFFGNGCTLNIYSQ